MDKETSDLKKAANPMVNMVIEQTETNRLLQEICDYKRDQQTGDIKFRNKWADAKVSDTRVSLILLLLANIAIYLDVVRINGEGAFISGLIELFK